MNFQKSILFFCFIAFCSTLSRAETPNSKAIDLAFTKVILDNGLTVLIHEDHKAPIVAVNVWYHVGSKNEPKGKNGFAHLFEHLMFQGSENFNDDYFKALEKIGATDLNGTTNEDRTNYFQNVPSTALDTALFMESDRMGHFVNAISQFRLDEQRNVVLNEKRQGQNRPYWGIAEELISKGAFPAGHPYSWTTIGSFEDLNSASLTDVKDWFRTYYGPSNATLTIVGDVQTLETLEKVKKYFGDIPPGPRISRMKEWIAKRTESKRATAQDDVPFPKILKIWNIPGVTSTEIVDLDTASDILSVGKSSRLYKDIVYDQQLASDISASIWPSEIASLFVIDATAKESVSLERLEQAINKTMQNFLQKGPTNAELKRSNTQYMTNFIRSLEKIGGFSGKANLLASNQTYLNDPGAYKARFDHRMKLKPSDVQAVAQKWLSTGDYNLEITPFPKFQNSVASLDRKTVPQPQTFPDVHFPKLQQATLSNGIHVILAERTHIPEVEMGVLIKAGFANDPKDKIGLSNITFDLLDEGTTDHTLFQISDMLADLGSSITSFSEMNYSGFYTASLKQNFSATLKILSEMIQSPAFSQKELDRVKKETIEGIQHEKSEPRNIASRVFSQLLFGKDHPYGVPMSGSGYENTVRNIHQKDVTSFYKTWSKPNNTTIVAVGDISLSQLVNELEKNLRGWSKADVPSLTIPKVAKGLQTGKMFLVDRPHSPQTAVYAGEMYPHPSDPKDHIYSIMNSILGGSFTSRINMNLREGKGWSYGARSGPMDLGQARFWMVRAPVQTDKTSDAIVEIQKEIRDFSTWGKPITNMEFGSQKSNAILELAGTWETNGSIYSSIKGLVQSEMDIHYYETFPQKLKAITLGEVSGAAKSVIHPSALTWLVVGDKEKILPGLQKLGFTITVLDGDGNVK